MAIQPGVSRKPLVGVEPAATARGQFWAIVLAGTRTLVRAGHEALPEIADRLAQIGRFRGTEHEGWAVQQAYALLPTANFSRSILEPAPPCRRSHGFPA